jgi:peptidoglycan/LPS O-acetylase OafA/YrhL
MALYYYRSALTFPTLPGVIIAVVLFMICKFSNHSLMVLPLYPLCSGLVMYICVFRLPRIPLPFDISYGVYLLHGPLIQFSLLFGIFRDTTEFLMLLLGCVLLLAFAAERYIEQPGIDLGKRLARGWVTRFSNAGT